MGFISGVFLFWLSFLAALGALVVFKWAYAKVTPYDEWRLIKEEQNTAAAIAFGGAVLGFAIALSGALSQSVSFWDFILWALVALIGQIVAFYLVRSCFLPALSSRIEAGEVSAAIMLAATSVSVGVLNAASMTY